MSGLRSLPSVERLAQMLGDLPHPVAVEAARAAIDSWRQRLASEPGVELDSASLVEEAALIGHGLLAPSPRRVVNATGVIVHTNLGRAPLPGAAREAVIEVATGYSDLEYDAASGERGTRQQHVVELVEHLTGAQAALVVNNGAAAALLCCAALGRGGEIIVSRGQLVEIGGSFRVPEIVAQSGARLVEVGTTNRTRRSDYEAAITGQTTALLCVHPSNFRSVGFVEGVGIDELCELGRRRRIPVIHDAGSGALAEAMPEFGDEPRVRGSVNAGTALTCFSADKLLGGPQAGIIAGSAEAVERCRRHPLARAMRIDKLSLAALAATLRLYLDPQRARREIPVLRMLSATEAELRSRAQRMAAAIEGAEVTAGSGRVGGGALPLTELPGPVCAVDPGPLNAGTLAGHLRRADPPVVVRIRDGRVILDPRTLSDEEADQAANAVAAARRG